MGSNPMQSKEKVKNTSIAVGMDDLMKKDTNQLGSELELVEDIKAIVEKELTKVDIEQRSRKEGFYSVAHLMDNSLVLAEKIISEKKTNDYPKIKTIADQVKRLLGYGSTVQNKLVHRECGEQATPKHEDIRIPTFNEIPDDWREGGKGQSFKNLFKEFEGRRISGQKVDQIDFALIQSMATFIERENFPQKNRKWPDANSLLLINLHLLAYELKKNEGKELPQTERNENTVNLIRGIFNYKGGSDVYVTNKGNQSYGKVGIIETPSKLIS